MNIPSVPLIDIQMLGSFSFSWNNQSVTPSAAPRLPLFLTYLILHADSEIPRKHLAFLLWPDSSEEQAQTNLRKHIFRLHEAFPHLGEVLIASRFSLRWINADHVRADVVEFQRLLAEATTANPDRIVPILRKSIELYKGELLPGCYDEWVLPLREAFRTQYLATLTRLSDLLEKSRNYHESIQIAQQLLHHDPLNEASYRRLIRLYALNDDRAAALRTYHTCVTQLREELGIDPEEETQAIYERLLHGNALPLAQPELAAHAPFMGREAEWRKLQERWKFALHGQPHFVLIAGEAGIGKTRLAEELLNWATHQGFCTVRSRCYAAEGRLTYAPVIEWLRAEQLRQHRNKLATHWLTELSRLLPEILSENPNIPAPEPITQSAQRHHLFEAATRALLAGEQPLILLIDDLQWCDKETLELLHFLLRNASTLSQSKVLLMGTARLPDEVDATHPLYDLLNPLRGGDRLTQLDLVRLSEVETGNLARQMSAQPLDARAMNQLFSDTAGNPLFVVETMRATQGMLSSNGSLESTTTTILPIEASESIVQHLPPKVLATIQSRLAQLSPTARELCEWAAIIGRAFTLDLLIGASKIAQDKAVNALDELWQRRIIREQGSDAYDFSHDRIRDVAAAGVSRVRRRYLHRRVAEALEGDSAGQINQNAAQIAAHYEAAGAIRKAIDFYKMAASTARSFFVTEQQIIFLERALQLLKELPVCKERDERELTLLNTLGPALATITELTVSRLREVYERSTYLSQLLGVTPNLALLRISAIHQITLRGFEYTESIGSYFLEAANKSALGFDPVLHVEGSYVLGVNAFWQGNFQRSQKYLQQAVDDYSQPHQERHLAEYGQATGIYCRTRLGQTLGFLGFFEQAYQHLEIALVLATELQHPFTLYLALAYSLWDACANRNIPKAEIYLRLFDSHVNRHPTQAEILYGLLSGWYQILCGNYSNSISQLQTYIVEREKWKPGSLYAIHAMLVLAEAYKGNGEFEKGLALVIDGITSLDDNRDYWCKAEFYRLKGDFLYRLGTYLFEAESCFQQAIDISRRQQAKSLELRAAMSMARLWDRQGKRSEAKELLAGIYNWFTEGFDTADMQEAKALLDQLT